MKIGPFSGMWFVGTPHDGFGFWFRLFGYGFHIRSSKGYIPLFSERNGYEKPLYICGLRIQFLKK